VNHPQEEGGTAEVEVMAVGAEKIMVEVAMAFMEILMLNRAVRIWRKIKVFWRNISSKNNQ